MRVFHCPNCATQLYFHNTACACGQAVSFDPETQAMQIARDTCANRADIACNWRAEDGGLCRSCAMTQTVPDLRAPENLPLWERSEYAKRWVLATLYRWGWFTASDPGDRPVFRMLSEQTLRGETNVTMGHADGTITINVSEAEDATRVERREEMGELYRTMVGHLRHEVAHFLFLRLADLPGFLDDFRARMGDERADYGEALKAHYANPRQPGETHITAYATAHPHEDWAETIAHLLHLVDLVDSMASTGLALPNGPRPGYDAYLEPDTEALVSCAVALSMAVNHVNRALDLPDLYPFVLTPQVREKMRFAHGWLRRA